MGMEENASIPISKFERYYISFSQRISINAIISQEIYQGNYKYPILNLIVWKVREIGLSIDCKMLTEGKRDYV